MHTVSLSADEVRAAVTMPEAIGALREAMQDLWRGRFEQPVRTVMRDGHFLVMSAHHRPSSTAIVKTLSLNFDRTPAIAGTVTWVETERAASLVADAAAVTCLRTGAIAGVATDALARPDADHLAIIGAGAQAPDQVRAVHAVRPLTRLTIADRDRSRADALASSLRDELPQVDIAVADSVREAVRHAAIVTCATTATEPVLSADDLPSTVHVNAIGAFRPTMRELPDDLLGHSTVVIDDLEAILEESGEIIHAIDAGAIDAAGLVPLGAATSQPLPRRDRTVFKTVGVAVEDWAIARLLAAKLF